MVYCGCACESTRKKSGQCDGGIDSFFCMKFKLSFYVIATIIIHDYICIQSVSMILTVNVHIYARFMPLLNHGY